MGETFLRSKTPVLILFVIIYALLSLYVMQRFSVVSDMGQSPDARAGFGKMVAGDAWRPFVYRALVPSMIRLVVEVTPADVQAAVNAKLQYSLFAGLLKRINLSYAQAVMAVILYLCLCGYSAVLYKMGTFFFPQSWAMALFMPAVGLLMIPAFTFHGLYIYDFAVLFLTAVCYYCLATQQWGWYFFWFPFACFNKETAIFIPVFFVLWYLPRLDTRHFILYWTLQCAIYIFVKIALSIHFMNNPGVFLEMHNSLSLSSLLGRYDFSRLGLYCTVVFLLTYRWTEKPLFARYILWIYPMMVVAYTIYGFPGEYRVFFDLFPLLTVLVTHTLIEGTGIAKAQVFNRPEYAHAPAVD
jgi:hypothetical protein